VSLQQNAKDSQNIKTNLSVISQDAETASTNSFMTLGMKR
jgi:hypothetical protein